ncbi:VOC family protein [Kineococcus sp. SYSU DK006]|uniref:VOC family protein n=1 Tax=Kineococcus sp. SYSU DK006 TaxID=3383127 RepID=UPI003D7D6CBA
MPSIRRFDHVGITVADLELVSAFPIAPRRHPAGTPSSFEEPQHQPDDQPGPPTAMANEPGLRNVAFGVDDLDATTQRLAADGYALVGGLGQYEGTCRIAYVRGPEGSVVSPAERIG